MINSAYMLGVKLAFAAAGVPETISLPAEKLTATLQSLPSELPGDIEPRGNEKDPKEPADAGPWSKAGPFSGDNMTSLGLVPEATAHYGY